jgi:hypothetical protein
VQAPQPALSCGVQCDGGGRTSEAAAARLGSEAAPAQEAGAGASPADVELGVLGSAVEQVPAQRSALAGGPRGVLFDIQNRKIGPYLTTISRMPAACSDAPGSDSKYGRWLATACAEMCSSPNEQRSCGCGHQSGFD